MVCLVRLSCGTVMVALVDVEDGLVKFPEVELNPSWSALVVYHWYSPEVGLSTDGTVSH